MQMEVFLIVSHQLLHLFAHFVKMFIFYFFIAINQMVPNCVIVFFMFKRNASNLLFILFWFNLLFSSFFNNQGKQH